MIAWLSFIASATSFGSAKFTPLFLLSLNTSVLTPSGDSLRASRIGLCAKADKSFFAARNISSMYVAADSPFFNEFVNALTCKGIVPT